MLLIRAKQDALREIHIPIKNNPKQENNKMTVGILERESDIIDQILRCQKFSQSS